ncbi:MAG: hypothetical protein HYT67_02310 [Candidatus Yanofskybacteria bacterium]|nr:hypothetical protein [Candidatus Yanofskybacteria bacterium]
MRAKLLLLLLLFTIGCSSNPKLQVTPRSPGEEKPPEPVALKVFPLISFAGISEVTIRIDYRIAPHPGNRSYWISWSDEGGEWGGTGRSLDGDNEPYVFPQVFVSYLYAGQYEIRLTLTRIENGKEKEYRAIQKFTVLGDP